MAYPDQYITAATSVGELELVRNLLRYVCTELALVDKEFSLFIGYPRADALRLLEKVERVLRERVE